MSTGASASTHGPLPEIDGYRLVRVIGEGGMSTVYLGTQVSLGREVAIKLMRPEALADEVSRRRFENEARTIARLEHPHIVGIHEVGRNGDGLPWYSMPYLPRGHVGQRDLRGDPQRVREILRALLSALAYAHARGVVHRDVKAENVLFDEADRPLLADFGIALRRGHGTRVTMTGLAVGSTAYMAPEQARGEQVDHRADLYSVGVLAWEMLAGALPYQADDALAMAIQHAQKPVPKLPPELRHWQRFMERALAKAPGRRFHDAAQMLAALDQVALSPHAPGAWLGAAVARGRTSLRRLPVLAWVALALLGAA
ncbi:serine/threonine-protein kinase, partial [Luteimonas sp. SDU101]|uniref:serine/threonine-protein kinase n=1 Tax=Luteimonas sp. SDU101 TaxID=3422593 RepID=UPI003EBDC648